MIPGAVYFDEFLTVDGRKEWNERAFDLFKNADLIFMDPDNGLLVKSVGKKSAKSVKYAFYEEVKAFIDDGKSVLVYNHRCRKPERQYFDDIDNKLVEEVKVYRYAIQKITFPKGTIRDYFAIPANEEHCKMFHEAFADMKNSKWGQREVCKLFPEWADSISVGYKTYEEYFFLEVEGVKFNEDDSFEDYKRKVVRYLMLCAYKYSEKDALSLVDQYLDDIKKSFIKKDSAGDIAIDIGYVCG